MERRAQRQILDRAQSLTTVLVIVIVIAGRDHMIVLEYLY
jgi:hypothetical protein